MLCSISIFLEILQSVLERSAMSCRRSLPGTLRWDARGCSPGTGGWGRDFYLPFCLIHCIYLLGRDWKVGREGQTVLPMGRKMRHPGRSTSQVGPRVHWSDGQRGGVGLHQEERVGIPGWRGFCWCSHWLAQSLVFPSVALMLCSTLTGSKTELIFC